MLRGKLRYKGFIELVNAFKEVGLLEEKEPVGRDWLEQVERTLEGVEGEGVEEKLVKKAVYGVKHYASHSKEEKEARAKRIISGFKYFGLLKPTKVPPPPLSSTTHASPSSKTSSNS